MQATSRWGNWLLFLLLSLIWGSSFILMKVGLFNASNIPTLTPYQVAALRMLSAGLILLPLTIRHVRLIPPKKIGALALAGLLGSFLPAFLFCIAETRIDSSLAGFLNALTPIMTIVMGHLFFGAPTERKYLVGVITAFSGMTILFLAGRQQPSDQIIFAGFVIAATLCYALNVNIASTLLQDISASVIAASSFSILIVPSLAVLWYSGYFDREWNTDIWVSTGASMLLGVLGTAVASILFYQLLKKAGGLFASMVTYGIPFVALAWGLAAGENIELPQIIGLLVILIGVYHTNR